MTSFKNGQACSCILKQEITNDAFSIYEVIRIFNGRPLFLEDNIERLIKSIELTQFPFQFDRNLFIEQLRQFIEINGIDHGNVKYLLVNKKGQIDEYFVQISHSYPTEKQYQQGVHTAIYQQERENPNIKYVNKSLRESADMLMQKESAYEMVLVNKAGHVTEGSRSNLFFIKNKILFTAPLSEVLPGTSRKRLINICQANHIEVNETPILIDQLNSFEAALITGTSPLILPIASIDQIEYNVNNKLLRRIMELYFTFIQEQ